ncbi:cell wall protein [Trichoderma ceciliae]
MNSLLQLFLLVFAAALAVSASSTPNITSIVNKLPPCSLECIVNGVTQDGCALGDLACGCSKINDLTKTVSPCLAKAGCTLDEMTQAASTVVQLCESADLVGNATSSDPASTTGASPATTSESDAGRFSREIGWAYAAVGVLTAMVIL